MACARATASVMLVLGVTFAAEPARAGETTRVSVSSTGGEGNALSETPSISADGRFIAFASVASNLIPGDANDWEDIFVHDRATGATERVSVASNGAQANLQSGSPSISTDGRFVAFQSFASNLVSRDVNGSGDVFVHDRETRTTTLVSVDSAGAQGNSRSYGASISTDGRFVAFMSFASNLVSGDTNAYMDVFVHDRASGATMRVSVSSAGEQGNDGSEDPLISTDGRFVAFASYASNLVRGDTNGRDIFVHDLATRATDRVSVNSNGEQSNWHSFNPSISANGRFVTFDTRASNLAAGDPVGTDTFVRDRATNATARVSVNPAIGEARGHSERSSVSPDGRFIAFASSASTLVPGDTNENWDIFIHDSTTAEMQRVSIDSSGGEGSGHSRHPSVSANGRFVAFASDSTSLVPGDTNDSMDVFVHDRIGFDLTSVASRAGTSEGGDIARVSGSNFVTDGTAVVRLGDSVANAIEATPSRLTVRTPAGSGTVEVTVLQRGAIVSLPMAYTFVSPDVAARFGNVNLARGDREDVLLVNALAGSEETREVSLRIGEAIAIVMQSPSSRARARFALYAWRGMPDANSLRLQPSGIGSMVFPSPLNAGETPQPIHIGNNFGDSRLGTPTFGTNRAPSRVGTLAGGVRYPATFALQGIIQDNSSQTPQRVSVTNAVILHVRP